MSKVFRRTLVAIYFVLGCGGIHFLGEAYASGMMEVLTVNPSLDLYANNRGFQYAAFWFTWGIALSFVLLFSATLLYRVLSSKSTKN